MADVVIRKGDVDADTYREKMVINETKEAGSGETSPFNSLTSVL
jgi:hypothetical protein